MNPAPNPLNLGTTNSDVKISENRALNIRRDIDTQKNFKITLEDIDNTIFDYFDNVINLRVLDNGNTIKVPVYYGSPEKWKASLDDGVLRDQQGKLQLPAIIFTRVSYEENENLKTFNRHLDYPIIQKFNEKNQYTNFSVLNNSNKPANEIFRVTLPDHVLINYEFIVWAEFISQMNEIMEKVIFASEDYWGKTKGFKFRVTIADYNNSTESSSDKDRMIRSTFSLKAYAYLLPDSFENGKSTFQKMLTYKKVLIGVEAVTSLDSIKNNKDSEKSVPYSWKNNVLSKDDVDYNPPNKNPNDNNILSNSAAIVSSPMNSITTSIWHPAPKTANDYGEEGWMAYDDNFNYIYTDGSWRRQPISNFKTF